VLRAPLSLEKMTYLPQTGIVMYRSHMQARSPGSAEKKARSACTERTTQNTDERTTQNTNERTTQNTDERTTQNTDERTTQNTDGRKHP